jgi:hypothetical protein
MNSTNSDAAFEVLDFVGGTLVHVNAGAPSLLWVGWFRGDRRYADRWR